MARQTRTQRRRGAEAPAVGSRARGGVPILGILAVALVAVSGLLAGVATASAPTQVTGPTTTPSTQPPTTAPTTPVTAAPVTTAPTTPTTAAPAPRSAPAPTPSGSSGGPRITPIVECMFFDAKTKQNSTVWGYQNLGPATSVPVGDRNHFDNPQGDPDGDVGQPTDFKAGRNKNVFVVTAVGESTWTLTYEETTATPGKGTICKTNPVPIVNTGLGGLVALAVVTGVMGLVLFWRMRRPRA
jgi:hypothetical protein